MKEKKVDKKKTVENLIKWSGWIIAIFSLIWALIPKNPKLQLFQDTKTDLISNEPVRSLKVYVDTIDVQKTDMNVSIYNLTAMNKGLANIKEEDYDKNIEIIVNNGTIIEPVSVIEASSDYLVDCYKENALPYSDSVLTFPKLMLDMNDYLTFRVAVLHPNSESPSFVVKGKIAGQHSIKIKERSEEITIQRHKGLDVLENVTNIIMILFCCLAYIMLFVFNNRRKKDDSITLKDIVTNNMIHIDKNGRICVIDWEKEKPKE